MAGQSTDSADDVQRSRDREALLKAIGRSVAQARGAANLSLVAAAEAAGITKDYLWRLEKGRQNVSIVTLAGVARATGTTVFALVATAKREWAAIEADEVGKA